MINSVSKSQYLSVWLCVCGLVVIPDEPQSKSEGDQLSEELTQPKGQKHIMGGNRPPRHGTSTRILQQPCTQAARSGITNYRPTIKLAKCSWSRATIGQCATQKPRHKPQAMMTPTTRSPTPTQQNRHLPLGPPHLPMGLPNSAKATTTKENTNEANQNTAQTQHNIMCRDFLPIHTFWKWL